MGRNKVIDQFEIQQEIKEWEREIERLKGLGDNSRQNRNAILDCEEKIKILKAFYLK